MSIGKIPGGYSAIFASCVNYDAQILVTINQILGPGLSSTSESLSMKDVDHALKLFREIQSPTITIQAFQSAISPGKKTDRLTQDLARQFYNALPVDLLKSFIEELWIAGDRPEKAFGSATAFAQYVVDSGLTHSEIAKKAVLAMR